MGKSQKYIDWAGENDARALELLSGSGGVIVSATKVGYIIMTTDLKGLEKKFDIKKIGKETNLGSSCVDLWHNWKNSPS